MGEQVSVRSFAEHDWLSMPDHRGLFYKELLSLSDAAQLGVAVSSVLHERIEPGGAVLPHTHDVAEIIHFIESDVSVLVGDGWRHCGPKDTLIVPKGVLHSVENRGELPSYQVSMFVPVVTGAGFTTFFSDGSRVDAEKGEGENHS